MKITVWVACSRHGQYKIFDDKPEWNETFGIWTGKMTTALMVFINEMEGRGLKLPELNWQSEPREMTIEVRNTPSEKTARHPIPTGKTSGHTTNQRRKNNEFRFKYLQQESRKTQGHRCLCEGERPE